MKLKKIIKDYVPNAQYLNTIDKQAKVIQDMYEQVQEFYSWLTSPAYREEFKGAQGSKGEQGERGPQGAKGDRGLDGIPGLPGAKGPKGNDGSVGPQGPAGPRGPQGIPGPKGDVGPRGYTGMQGPQGIQGEKGDKGDIGAFFGLGGGVYDSYAEMEAEAPRIDAAFYLVATHTKENGDVYVYRQKYDDFIFLNNIIYDLFFQLMQASPGKNFLRLLKGEHCDKYGTTTIDKQETIDRLGYLHTDFTLNYLKGNGIKKTEWTEDLADSHQSTLVITFDNGNTATIKVKNGKGIASISKIGTNVLVDTYTIIYSEGESQTFNVTNGKGINRIEKTSTDVLTDTYTIYWNDNTTTTYLVTNGRGIVKIEKTATAADNITDTYTITYNDNTTSTFTVVNGNGIVKVEKTETNVLVDTYTITFTTGVTTTFQVTNGRGITKVEKTNTNALVDTYTITYNDTTTSTFTVTNGRNGINGTDGTNGSDGITPHIDATTKHWMIGNTDTNVVAEGYSSYQLAVAQGYQGTLQEFLKLITEVYIGAGKSFVDVFIAANKHENIVSHFRVSITCNNNKIIIIYPSNISYTNIPTMNGIDIPVTISTVTKNNVVYTVLISNNAYTGTFNISI